MCVGPLNNFSHPFSTRPIVYFVLVFSLGRLAFVYLVISHFFFLPNSGTMRGSLEGLKSLFT